MADRLPQSRPISGVSDLGHRSEVPATCDRRRALAAGGSFVAAWLIAPASFTAAQEGSSRRVTPTAPLRPGAPRPAAAAPTAAAPRRYELKLEAQGTLELDPSGQAPVKSPFRVVAGFDFAQRCESQGDSHWAARRFAKAESAITVGRGSTVIRLSEPERVIVERQQRRDERQVEARFDRAGGSLTSDEIDLIRLPLISPASTAWFRAAADQGLNETWTPEGWAVAAALGIDVVTDNRIRCRVLKRAAGKTTVETRGSVSGSVGNVATEIELIGTVELADGSDFPLAAQWQICEDRALGPATPGFSATTKLELTDRGPTAWSADDETAYREVRESTDGAGSERLVFESKRHGFRLTHSSKWTPIGDNSQAAILRMVDQGDLIAQAHITRLQSLEAGTKLTADRYRKDVAEAIGDGNGQVVDVSDFVTARGYDGIRAIVSAEVSGVAIQWIYLHIADATGRRCGWVITVEQDRLDRLGNEDQTLADAFELLDAPEPAEKPAAPAAGASPPARPASTRGR